jgi:hypothetical protein
LLLAAHQTQYLPYPGIIHKIDRVHVFVFQDDLQYVKQEWQNRNRIRTSNGWRYLTIPVHVPGSKSKINEVFPARHDWLDQHYRVIKGHYYTSPYFYRLDDLWNVLWTVKDSSLAEISYHATMHIINYLGITDKKIILESTINLSPEEIQTPDDRLIALCNKFDANVYFSGSGGRNYMNIETWRKAKISVEWQEFVLHQYPQIYHGWVPNLSIIDLLLSVAEPLSHIRRP